MDHQSIENANEAFETCLKTLKLKPETPMPTYAKVSGIFASLYYLVLTACQCVRVMRKSFHPLWKSQGMLLRFESKAMLGCYGQEQAYRSKLKRALPRASVTTHMRLLVRCLLLDGGYSATAFRKSTRILSLVETLRTASLGCSKVPNFKNRCFISLMTFRLHPA